MIALDLRVYLVYVPSRSNVADYKTRPHWDDENENPVLYERKQFEETRQISELADPKPEYYGRNTVVELEDVDTSPVQKIPLPPPFPNLKTIYCCKENQENILTKFLKKSKRFPFDYEFQQI